MSEAAKHPCPVPGCRSMLKPHLSLCGVHWRRIPRSMQNYLVKAREAKDEFYAAYLQAAVDLIIGRLAK